MLTAALTLALLGQGQAPIDHALAHRYFQEARWLAEDEGQKLWGVSLHGPMIFVDPRTRYIVANQADAQGKLKREGDVWTGTLPEGVVVANTGVDWAGTRWAMCVWPIQRSFTTERYRLLIHENFHRIQPAIGLEVLSGANNHLDTEEGRAWLRIECAALAEALKSRDADARKQAVADALSFRKQRHKLFPEAVEAERLMELNEGLAEYTGIKVRGTFPQETRYHMGERLASIAARRPTFAYSFAYETGPAYGLLLDVYQQDWTRSVSKDSDLAKMLATALDLTPTADETRASVYGGKEILAEEAARSAERARISAEFKARLIDGPVLVLPLVQPNFSFDPNRVTQLEPHGTIHPSLTLQDEWGKITVQDTGMLIMKDFKSAHVSAPTGDLEGAGWKLDLNPGWKLVPGGRKGDYTLAKS